VASSAAMFGRHNGLWQVRADTHAYLNTCIILVILCVCFVASQLFQSRHVLQWQGADEPW
jgi:hypothetical protein